MKSSLIQSLTVPANSIISVCDLASLKDSKNLKCLTIAKVSFNNYKFSDLPISMSPEIQFLDLSGSTGIKIIPNAQNVTGLYYSPVPFNWGSLTRLGIINMRDMGLSAQYVDNLIIGLSQVYGIGSASATKKIYIDGSNASPTAASSMALATLQGLGWTIYHSDPSKVAELEQNPCCDGDCVDCGGGTPTPTVPIVLNIPQTVLSNANSETYTFNVTGVVLGGNINFSPATNINNTIFNTVDIEIWVSDTDTVTVTITNDGGDDIIVPPFNYHVFINP